MGNWNLRSLGAKKSECACGKGGGEGGSMQEKGFGCVWETSTTQDSDKSSWKKKRDILHILAESHWFRQSP